MKLQARNGMLLRAARPFTALLSTASLLAISTPAAADGGVTYVDVSDAVGVDYSRAPSSTIANRHTQNSLPSITFFDIALYPLKADGAPGVSIFDYDNDGDLDFFVSNGPGAPHSLYANQLEETGQAVFIDLADLAGVEAVAQDGTGSCFGDIDNDGDHDLLVLGRQEQHRLFVNNGDGTFDDLGAASGIGAGVGAAACAMGDIDNDGLLDIAIAETADWSTFLAIVAVPFAMNVHNQLYRSLGGGVFEDVSVSSGFTDLASGGMPAGAATVSWAISMIDYDEDGDIDILHGDDQAAVPGAARGGADRGYTQLFENDGTGHFTNQTIARGLDVTAHWMGFAWADYDCDGGMDFFNTNVGDYIYQKIFEGAPIPYSLGEWPSGWFFSNAAGGFDFPPINDDLVATPWGWGSSVLDYDNDGDADTVYHGGLHMGFINALDNPGTMLRNTGVCSGHFEWDQAAIPTSHARRGVEGMAVGDLNRDGFPDMVSAAGFVVPDDHQLDLFPGHGSPFDATAYVNELITPTNNALFGPGWEGVWNGKEMLEGDTLVEYNSADNGNHWVSITPKGTIGITDDGSVNRDGIGAIITVTPHNENPQKRPVEAGGTYASQSSLEQLFGLGGRQFAQVDVQWPGGVRNRLYGAHHGHRYTFPEIPCSIDDPVLSFIEYKSCVDSALDHAQDAGIIGSNAEKAHFKASALLAYVKEH